MSCDRTRPRKTELPEGVVRSFMEFQALEDERRRFMADPVDRMKFAAARHAVVSDIEQQMFKCQVSHERKEKNE